MSYKIVLALFLPLVTLSVLSLDKSESPNRNKVALDTTGLSNLGTVLAVFETDGSNVQRVPFVNQMDKYETNPFPKGATENPSKLQRTISFRVPDSLSDFTDQVLKHDDLSDREKTRLMRLTWRLGLKSLQTFSAAMGGVGVLGKAVEA